MFCGTLVGLFISLSNLFVALGYAFVSASADGVVVVSVRVQLVLSHEGAPLAELLKVFWLGLVHAYIS